MDIPEEPKYKGLPRRYEETKPALEQVFTHNSILRVGEKILGKVEANSSKLKDAAIRQCEERVWQEAEVYKDKCVERALEKASREESSRIEALKRQQEQFLQGEIARVTELMRQKNVEDRFEERKDGENRAQEMLQQLQKKNDFEKMTEVKSARNEEQATAKADAIAAQHGHEEEMKNFFTEMEEAKNVALVALQYKLDDLRNESVQKAREEEREIAVENLKEVTQIHENEADTLCGMISQLTLDKEQLESDLKVMTNERDDYVIRYNELQKEFTSFIEGCRPDFSGGQADFLLPPT